MFSSEKRKTKSFRLTLLYYAMLKFEIHQTMGNVSEGLGDFAQIWSESRLHRLVGEQQPNSIATLKSTTQHSHRFCFDVFQCNTVIAVCLGVLLVFQNLLAIYKMSHVNID